MILIAGLGSIGRRHLRNLAALGVEDILLYRTGKSTLPDDDLVDYPTVHDLDEALARKPCAVFITNPTALHMPVALEAARAGCHLFLEKPISHTLDGVAHLAEEAEQRDLKVFVGFQFRFHPTLRIVRRWLDEDAIGPVVSASAHWAEYLPGWHPWEDYREGYSARADLGGGVLLTLCHPFDYLRWLLGEVETVHAATSQGSGLDLDVEDTALVTLRFASGALGSVYLDYVARPPTHGLRIIGRYGSITWQSEDGTARLYRRGTLWGHVKPPLHFERNTLFMDEVRHFLDCLTNQEDPACSLEDGKRALEIVIAAKQSARERRDVGIREFI